MEARSIIEEVILQKAAYAGRSLVHHRFLRKEPDAATGADDGLFAVLFTEFAARTAELPALFDPHAAAVALRPSVAALKRCVALLSGTETMRGQEPATDEVFSAPDAFGWAYQYWNTEEKDRVFEAVRTKKGTKIEGADIIPATQLYTEPYMVKFLVQNSLGALWMSLHPDSRLCDGWEYYVRDADRAPAERPPGGRSVRDFTFLDPALGSGHFHLEAFDLIFAIYREENPALTPREIAASILNRNLFGIDLDERAVQIAEAALWMKAKDAAPELEASDLDTFHDHLVATNIRLPRGGDHLEAFLHQHPEDAPLRPALELVFRGLEHADELGSLLQIEEPVDRELRRLKAEADAAGTTPPMQPDMFRATAVQLALPVGVESYEAWKAGALDRLKAHFEQEAEAADSVRAFFGASARKGLALFDLLARRYDVVAANPPYMGSKKMGPDFKAYVTRHFPQGKRDLYAAFILRCIELAQPAGRVSMVTQQSWMFLRSFAELRAVEAKKLSRLSEGEFRGLLRDTTLETLAHLGPGAFAEISGEVVNTVMFVLVTAAPPSEHDFPAFRLVGSRSPMEKAALLERPPIETRQRLLFRTRQSAFLGLPESPVVYWLSARLLEILQRHGAHVLGDKTNVSQGLTTGNTPRFVRFFWECPVGTRWWWYTAGGGFRRWAGNEWLTVDWEADGRRLKSYVRDNYPPEKFTLLIKQPETFGQQATYYGAVAGGAIGARLCSAAIFGDSAPGVLHTKLDRYQLAGLLNSRLCSFLIRALSASTLSIRDCYVVRLPFHDSPLSQQQLTLIGRAARVSEQFKRSLVSAFIDERCFDAKMPPAPVLRRCWAGEQQRASSAASYLCSIQGALESWIPSFYSLDSLANQLIEDETGTPAGWFPMLNNYDVLPPLPDDAQESPEEVNKFLADHERRAVTPDKLAGLQQRVRQLYEAGPGVRSDADSAATLGTDNDEAEDDEEETASVGARLPIPSETFLEELSQKLEVHPISIYWLLKEGIEQEGWRCLPEEKRLTEDRFTVLVLRMLGHRWAKQMETGEPLPDWADLDGVIPLSPGSSEPTLAARVLERLRGEFPGGDPSAIRAEFEEIVGTPLGAWLASGFFARHIPQFKKRPIAWQLQSQPAAQPGRRRSAPARKAVFACLVYYHRLDADLLPKLRSYYVAVLRTAHETELRTLEAVAHPTHDQAARKAELEVLVDELNRFDAQLQAVAESGFGPAPLQPRLRQLAVDDAMLAMKARWLARLRDTLQAASLADWQTAATALGHHADFPRWIAAAIANLPHHCAKAGAKFLDAAKLPEDPTPTTLATVICAEADAMTAAALDRACAEWEHEWGTHVIEPLRARISAANSALDALSAELETLDGKNFARAAEISQEQKRLRAEVKAWKRDVADKTGQAEVLAARIRKWTSPEPATWEPWLAGTPLFDEVSSLDGHRAVPVTIRDFIQQESLYAPDLNDGVRVNIAPLQRAGLLAAEVLAAKDVDKAIADRAEWRADERRWVREGKLPQPGWWPANDTEARP